MLLRFLLILHLLPLNLLLAADAVDIDEQTRNIAQELRCVVCQNLSVADSPSEMAQQMRGIIRQQLSAGKNPQQIKNFFVSKYGEWVLLAPTTQGFSLLVWVLPFVVLIAGLASAFWFIRRWSTRKREDKGIIADSELLTRVRSEAASDKTLDLDPEDSSPRAQLLQERDRLYTELKELQFDFQAGKLAASDYATLKLEIENKAAGVLQQLDLLLPPHTPASQTVARQTSDKKRGSNEARKTYRGWQLATGGVLLLLFGLTLGIALTNSVRPRESTQDSMTGDFLTGTAGSESAQFLQQGKSAFAKQDWPKAIEAFKQALAVDPNLPEAHAYMGFILVQAGHADGALLAFEKALAVAPNLPMALWGKGMALYQGKQDYAGARETFEKLLQIIPAGAERVEVEKILAEMPQGDGEKLRRQPETGTPPTSANQQIAGRISIDPKFKANVDGQATLFIIARPSNAAKGPPLAVKKIDRPVFPVSYSLGPENVMMQGVPFTGTITITARLDKDGNPTTRQPGDLTGDYKKNPVTVGSKNIDIVLDQVVQ